MTLCRDEFSLDFRTEQYREQLELETKHAKHALDLLRSQNMDPAGNGADSAASKPIKWEVEEGVDKPFLYDLVFEKDDTAHTGASKVHRCCFPCAACRCMLPYLAPRTLLVIGQCNLPACHAGVLTHLGPHQA